MQVLVIIALLTGFASGALPLNTSKAVDLGKLKTGQAVYNVNK